MKIKIACTSGIQIPLNEMMTFPGALKKHSQLEIERVVDSIVKNGFLFPIAIGKIKDKNYVIDGECRLFALQELEYRGFEIPDIPIFYVRTNDDTIKRNILIGTSTNHCVTKYSLKSFSDKETLLSLAFNEGELLDLHDVSDFENLEFEKPKRENNVEDDYFSLLVNGDI